MKTKQETVAITGNTFPVKDKLREMGGKWDGENKCWRVPADKAEEAQKLVSEAPVEPRKPGSAPRFNRCKQCWAAASRYVRIYRNGICSQCYRDEREQAAMEY